MPRPRCRQALAMAEVNPDEIDYVNAHATGTPVGDACEARALQAVFGDVLLECAGQLDEEYDGPFAGRGGGDRSPRVSHGNDVRCHTSNDQSESS